MVKTKHETYKKHTTSIKWMLRKISSVYAFEWVQLGCSVYQLLSHSTTSSVISEKRRL